MSHLTSREVFEADMAPRRRSERISAGTLGAHTRKYR